MVTTAVMATQEQVRLAMLGMGQVLVNLYAPRLDQHHLVWHFLLCPMGQLTAPPQEGAGLQGLLTFVPGGGETPMHPAPNHSSKRMGCGEPSALKIH
jgi:hypothetical protein